MIVLAVMDKNNTEAAFYHCTKLLKSLQTLASSNTDRHNNNTTVFMNLLFGPFV